MAESARHGKPSVCPIFGKYLMETYEEKAALGEVGLRRQWAAYPRIYRENGFDKRLEGKLKRMVFGLVGELNPLAVVNRQNIRRCDPFLLNRYVQPI